MSVIQKGYTLIIILFFTTLIPQWLFSQESPGITQGNFSGSATARINPATMLQSKLYFDVHLISVGAFGQNNFAYIPGSDFNLMPLIQNSEQLPTYDQTESNYLYYTNDKIKSGAAVSNNYALSAFLQTGDHAFAFHTAARSYNTFNQIPYEIPILGVESLGYEPLQHILFEDKHIDVAALAWGEIGLSYAYAFHKVANQHWAAGITLKYLMGYGGMFAKVENVDYMVLDRKTINFTAMNADFGFALPIDYGVDSDFPDDGPLFKGSGIGADLGITYTVKKEGYQDYNRQRICEQPYKDYFWRFGISILDLGSINFKNNAQKHEFRDVNTVWENLDDVQFEGLNSLMGEVSDQLMGSPDASYAADNFKIGLPTALSMQFDYHYDKNWYLNATLVHPLQISQYSVRRPAQLALTPRYETDWFEAMLPVSLYEYQIPRIGAAVRLGFLTIGTDRLGTLLGISDINGMDIYASVKINFRKGVCLGNRDTGACYNADNYKPRKSKRFLGIF
ncbi:MAG: hypothetical protein KJ578_15605 [Bacteroidetes bacterium]|nr:hypothetical protein [Bacteroidota bacterium]MBU1578128.1 hypothetical protein [Bacteroidota bacterium]MBU2465188.1 hypothetical protein [Bacteroidota bacterium]MBU2559204.1 hypothetical protein [Bacteroidota bacterium]